MPLRGESLKILAKALGHSVYTKCSIRQKGQDHMVEKLAAIYSGYTDLLSKNTKVEHCAFCSTHPAQELQGFYILYILHLESFCLRIVYRSAHLVI